jgi:hypothetical protein
VTLRGRSPIHPTNFKQPNHHDQIMIIIIIMINHINNKDQQQGSTRDLMYEMQQPAPSDDE